MMTSVGEPLSRDVVADFALRHVGQIVAYAMREQRRDDSLGPLEWHSGVVRRAVVSSGGRRAANSEDPLHRGEFDIIADPNTDLPLTQPTKTSGAFTFPHPRASYYNLMPEAQYMRDASRASALRIQRLEDEVRGLKTLLQSAVEDFKAKSAAVVAAAAAAAATASKKAAPAAAAGKKKEPANKKKQKK